jgi:exodeoxyribonuclease VII small subunit
MTAKNSLDFEKALEQLSHSVQQLESGNLPLEEALKQFEQGVKLGNQCQTTLQEAQQRVNKLVEGQQTPQPQDSASEAINESEQNP